jgi:hypothetical protein
MEEYEKIIDLNSEIDAEILSEILNDKKIPFGIVSSGDSAIGGIWEMENGWGYVEAPPQYRDEIMSVYQEMEKSEPKIPDAES